MGLLDKRFTEGGNMFLDLGALTMLLKLKKTLSHQQG